MRRKWIPWLTIGMTSDYLLYSGQYTVMWIVSRLQFG